MNETAIVKFLAESMGWWEADFAKPDERKYVGFWLKKTKIGTFPPTNTVFDPMNDISHAFMVVDFIKDDWYKIEWLAGLYNVKFTKPGMKSAEQTYHEHTSENLCKAICIAATRALATYAQIVEVGL